MFACILCFLINIEWRVFCERIGLFICSLGAMDLAAYSMDCEGDLGDRLGYIVTLILTFVAFSDTLFDLIPDVPYLTFLVCVNIINVDKTQFNEQTLNKQNNENRKNIFYFVMDLQH